MQERSLGWPPLSVPCLLQAASVTLVLLPQHAGWHWVALLQGMHGGDGGAETSLLFHPSVAWLDGHQNCFPCFLHVCFAAPALLAAAQRSARTIPTMSLKARLIPSSLMGTRWA